MLSNLLMSARLGPSLPAGTGNSLHEPSVSGRAVQSPGADAEAVECLGWLVPRMRHARSSATTRQRSTHGPRPAASHTSLPSPRQSLIVTQNFRLRRQRYREYASQLSQFSDAHHFYKLMMWCHDNGVLIHPAVQMHRRTSPYRDHVFTVSEDVPRLTPLLAIPERLVIGFKSTGYRDSSDLQDAQSLTNDLHDEQRQKQFHVANAGEDRSDADICAFFFECLGMIVADLVTARSSPLTDPRYIFAESLGRVRTMINAPYFDESVVIDSTETSLADILLQMIRNYINGGPLVSKIDRQDLRWAVSVCLSHATPLPIGTMRSIGIIPLVHLMSHGGSATNAVLVTRNSHPGAAEKLAAFFTHQQGIEFLQSTSPNQNLRSTDALGERLARRNGAADDGRWIYLVLTSPLQAGEEVKVQVMAPVCEKDTHSEQMWRLSCGTVPETYLTSAQAAALRESITAELLRKGHELLKASRCR